MPNYNILWFLLHKWRLWAVISLKYDNTLWFCENPIQLFCCTQGKMEYMIRNGFLKVGTQLLVFNHEKHVLLAQVAGEDNWYKSDQPVCQYYLCMNWHRLAKLMLKFQCFAKIGSFVIKLLHSSTRKTSEDQKPRNWSWINVCRSWTNHI